MTTEFVAILLFFLCWALLLKLVTLLDERNRAISKLKHIEKSIGPQNYSWILEREKDEKNNRGILSNILFSSVPIYNFWMRIIK